MNSAELSIPKEIQELPLKELDCIQALWEKLNQIHLADSKDFQGDFHNLRFEKRIASIKNLPAERVYILILVDKQKIQGYCFSTVQSTPEGKIRGEVESLYLEEEYRGKGYGRKLVQKSMDWFNAKGCTQIDVAVAAGHESVLPFYENLGFRTQKLVLRIPAHQKT